MKTIEIIVCDDHEIFRNGIKTVLQGETSINIIAETRNGKECLEKLNVLLPDVVLLDINMPEMDGIECLQKIKANYPFIKVIALTQFDEKRFVKQMLKYGADGYLLKDTSKREILVALHEVMKNRQVLADKVDVSTPSPPEANTLFPDFSHREKEIIKLLCHENSTKQVADALCISPHTVESHRANIMKKLGVANLAGLVRWAVNNEMDC